MSAQSDVSLVPYGVVLHKEPRYCILFLSVLACPLSLWQLFVHNYEN